VGELIFHTHGFVVAVDGCNGKHLVGTEAHRDRRVAGRHDSRGTVGVSQPVNNTASDGLVRHGPLLLMTKSR